MAIQLFKHQEEVLDKIKTGSILCGGVGSGKSITAIAYYFIVECGGQLPIAGQGEYIFMTKPKDLYIITTAKKRDNLEWDQDLIHFLLSKHIGLGLNKTKIVIDSWNNIKKYTDVRDSFFIFDEQRLVGSGAWVKSFYRIARKNNWILLSATPGDTWMDYIPVFVANGFYKNRTDFIRRHVVYSNFTKFPKIDRYTGTAYLAKLKNLITVNMEYEKKTLDHHETIHVPYDEEKFNTVFKKRWNPYKNKPIKNISECCYLMRRVVNGDESRIEAIRNLLKLHSKIIIFYNFDYELEMLREFSKEIKIPVAEWNGHKHEEIPKTNKWIYLVQYVSGAEGWNCIETNCITFFSQNYSYKTMVQASGRIDRLNTSFKDLYYYHIRSTSAIDTAILKCLKQKKKFNEKDFISF